MELSPFYAASRSRSIPTDAVTTSSSSESANQNPSPASSGLARGDEFEEAAVRAQRARDVLTQQLARMDAPRAARDAHTSYQARRSREARNSYEARRERHRSENTRTYRDRISTEEGPSTDVRRSIEEKRGSGDSRRETDSFSSGSREQGLTREQLENADSYGGVRTRSRAELEMLKRRMADLEQGRPSHQCRANSAPAAAQDTLPNYAVSSANASRQSSHVEPISIVIHNSGGLGPAPPPPPPLAAASPRRDLLSSPTMRRARSLLDFVLPDTDSRAFKACVYATKGLLFLIFGGGFVGVGVTVFMNRQTIQNNHDQTISALEGMHAPPPY